ncbi:MAG: hypothetical protein ACYSUF_14205 [Planctomycetota bacterium]
MATAWLGVTRPSGAWVSSVASGAATWTVAGVCSALVLARAASQVAIWAGVAGCRWLNAIQPSASAGSFTLWTVSSS